MSHRSPALAALAGAGAGIMTPRSVASDSDPSSTGPVASLAAPDLQHPSSPSMPHAAPAAPPVAPAAPLLLAAPYAPQPVRSVPDDGPSQTEINARNQVELHETTLKYIAMKRDSQPLNTRDAFGPRQKEWRAWCLRKRFADGELVTEGKMVAFLDQEVVGRVVRTQPRKDGSGRGRSSLPPFRSTQPPLSTFGRSRSRWG